MTRTMPLIIRLMTTGENEAFTHRLRVPLVGSRKLMKKGESS